jgi:hypothetical protein
MARPLFSPFGPAYSRSTGGEFLSQDALHCTAMAKPCGTAEPTLRLENKMYTLIITAAIVVGLAFWVAAARLLRKFYWVSRKEARCLRLKEEGSNDNERLSLHRTHPTRENEQGLTYTAGPLSCGSGQQHPFGAPQCVNFILVSGATRWETARAMPRECAIGDGARSLRVGFHGERQTSGRAEVPRRAGAAARL